MRRPRLCNIYAIICLSFIFIFVTIIYYQGSSSPQIPVNFINRLVTLTMNSSEDYLKVNLNLTHTNARCNDGDYLLIYVLSTVNNFRRRKVIRSTWGTKQNGVCFIFVLGQLPSLGSNTASVEKMLNDEKEKYQDIFQIGHPESYANVIYKEVGALIWASKFYPKIPFLFKTDDDLIVDIILVSEIVQILLKKDTSAQAYIKKHRSPLVSLLSIADHDQFFRGGWSMDYQPTLRDGKFGVPVHVWPNSVLPLYCSGFGWIMSANTRDKLVEASYIYPSSKIAWIGDVFVSGFLAKAANVKCTGLEIDFEQTASANCSCSMVNNPMLTVCSSTFHAGGGGNEVDKYLEYEKAWRVIQLRHNLSHTTIDQC